jgi:hypothetical protein
MSHLGCLAAWGVAGGSTLWLDLITVVQHAVIEGNLVSVTACKFRPETLPAWQMFVCWSPLQLVITFL